MKRFDNPKESIFFFLRHALYLLPFICVISILQHIFLSLYILYTESKNMLFFNYLCEINNADFKYIDIYGIHFNSGNSDFLLPFNFEMFPFSFILSGLSIFMVYILCYSIFLRIILLLNKNHESSLRSLRELAMLDGLTGLLNRRGFMELARKEMAKASRHKGISIGMLFFDIDNFKKINDTYGHEIGDRVIEALALNVKKCFRIEDIYCRYSGDEFIVLLSSVSEKDLHHIAERLRSRCLSTRIETKDGENVTFSISIGGAILPDFCIDDRTELDDRLKELKDMADRALYSSKRNGRNMYTYYNGEK